MMEASPYQITAVKHVNTSNSARFHVNSLLTIVHPAGQILDWDLK